MTTYSYRQLIMEGINGPSDTLAEILDFVYFLRKRVLQPQAFEEERQSILLNADLKQLWRSEMTHLEEEFDQYEKLYPKDLF